MSSHPLARAVEGVQERTVSGALITGGCVLLILSLLTGELSSYFSPALIHHLGLMMATRPLGVALSTCLIDYRSNCRRPLHMSKVRRPRIIRRSSKRLRDAVDRINFREPHAKELYGWSDASTSEGCTLDGKLRVGKVSAHFSVGLAPAQPSRTSSWSSPFYGKRRTPDHQKHDS